MSERSRWRVGILLILLLAAGLRFFRLDAQSFWNDEGNSARLAERSISLILEGAAGDIHPPLYYLALHFWRGLLGPSELALRAFSALGGLGLVGLTYALGSRLFGPAVGLAASFLAAINPFQVYYSQEARAYIWVALLGAAAAFAALQLWEAPGKGNWRWPAVYGLIVTAGLYTHYLFPLTLMPINLVALAFLLRRRAYFKLAGWIGLHLVAAALYLPWAPIAWRQLTTWPSAAAGSPLGSALLETLRLLSLGPTVDPADVTVSLLGIGFLLVLGALPLALRPRAANDDGVNGFPAALGLIWTILWLATPIALIISLGLFKEAFLKFMLVASPPFCLLAGRGVILGFAPNAAGGSRARLPFFFSTALGVGLALSFSYESLHNLYLNPAFARADYRGMARAIQEMERPGDAVILNAANQWEVFTYYYPHVERVYPLPRSRPVRESEVVSELEAIVARHDRIFALFWAEAESDPQRVVERWLDDHAYKASDTWWGDVRLITYAVPAAPATEVRTPIDARLGDAIALRGYTLLADRLAPADIVQITLFWEAVAPVDQRYKVFLHLLNGEGVLVAQHDSEPGGGLGPTTAWELGVRQIDNHGVLLPVDAPPGDYQLVLGLYPLGNPTGRLPVTLHGQPAGDALSLGAITVVAP